MIADIIINFNGWKNKSYTIVTCGTDLYYR